MLSVTILKVLMFVGVIPKYTLMLMETEQNVSILTNVTLEVLVILPADPNVKISLEDISVIV